MTTPSPDRLPTFAVIGAAKAGTTSLYRYLDLHPEIRMSRRKETQYFLREDYREGLDEYAGYFPEGGIARGDNSPGYSNYPRHRDIPRRIHEVLPDVKLIYLVRDPIDRAQSNYYHRYFNRTESREINEVFAEIQDPDDPYIARGRYAMQLDQYLPHFPISRFLSWTTMSFERSAIRRWNRSSRSSASIRASRHRSSPPSITGSSDDNRVSSWWPAFVRPGWCVPDAGRCPGVSASQSSEPCRNISCRPVRRASRAASRPATREQLADFFREDAARLREITGKKFESWSV